MRDRTNIALQARIETAVQALYEKMRDDYDPPRLIPSFIRETERMLKLIETEI